MRKLSESVWGDIRKKSLGQEDRIEDNIDLMTIDEFSNYVDKHYVGTTNHIKMKSGRAGQEEQFFDILVLIKTVHFKSGGTSTAFIRLQYFFNKVHNEIYVCITNKSVVKEITLSKSKNDKIEIVPTEDVNILYKKVDGEFTPTYDIKLNDIKAPIKNGDIVGKLYVMNNDKIVNEVNLTVKEDVKKCNLIELYGKYLKNIFVGNITF